MKRIGTFKKLDRDIYAGSIATLSIQSENVVIHPLKLPSELGPHYKVMVDNLEMGLGWRDCGGSVIRVELDDPSFSAPVNAQLIWDPHGSTLSLMWSR